MSLLFRFGRTWLWLKLQLDGCQIDTKLTPTFSCGQASARGFIDMVRTLIEHEANVNAQNRVGDTALSLACYQVRNH